MKSVNLKKYRNIYFVIAAIAGTALCFENFKSKAPTLADLDLTDDHKQLIQLVVSARNEIKLAHQATTPAAKKSHADKAKAFADQLKSLNDKAVKKGEVQAASADDVPSCRVRNRECPDYPDFENRVVKINIEDQSECLDQAEDFQKHCGGMSTASFYKNGTLAAEKVAGTTCVMVIKDCPGNRDLVGMFPDQDSAANQDVNACLKRVDYYQNTCKSKSLSAAFYTDGKLVASKNPPK